MPLRLEAAILSRTRSPITSCSNWAKDSSTLSVSRPMLEVVLNDWVIETLAVIVRILADLNFEGAEAVIEPPLDLFGYFHSG